MKKMLFMFCAVFTVGSCFATGFQERFALADDRGSVLAELLPGSDNAFYYRALNYLNKGDFDHFKTTMDAWHRERKSGWPNQRARELLNREALLRYAVDPQGSLKYLRVELGLHFNHSRKDASRVKNQPSTFDNHRIDTGMLLLKELKERSRDVSHIEPEANFLLENVKLTADQRLDLLKRLDRPDFKGLTALILADLKERKGASFGSLQIHSRLTLAQLDELAKQRPDLWHSERFVESYLSRLLPSDEVDMMKELDERDAYYGRLWSVAKNLIQAFNSRKANILYNWIQNDLKRGQFNKTRFIEYIKYPRVMHYVPKLSAQKRSYALDFRKQFNVELLPRIGNEEPLVRKCLLKIFKDAPDYKEFASIFRDEFLRAIFAEAKVTSGQGTPEQWISWMSRSQYDAVKRRVDVEFADDNPLTVGHNEPVVLSAYIKNVPSLIVKVYEINTENCYRETGKPVDLAMNLNGLTATYEKRHEYKESELIRVKREYKFPDLKERGVYIIELIGNGISSRALVQKGHLAVVPEITAGGHAFAVFDEENNPVENCSGWFNGSQFKMEKDGRIYIPFSGGSDACVSDDPSASPRVVEAEKNLVVSCGKFAALVKFMHLGERYSLNAGFYVDREALIAGEQAEVVVRPELTLNGRAVALSLLKNSKLAITSVDLDGVESRSVVADLKLGEDTDFVHKFRVPERCVKLTFSLEGTVENLALNKEQDLRETRTFSFNESERGKDVNHLFLSRHSGGYTLEVRGKNGEAVVDVPVNLYLKHRFFTKELSTSLKSDDSGRIELGALEEIESFRGSWDGVDNRQSSWTFDASSCTYVQNLHGIVGETLLLAVAEELNVEDDLSLLELRRGLYVKEWSSALSYKDGYVSIKGLPAGDYELTLVRNEQRINVRVTEAKEQSRFLVSDRRVLERPHLKPLSIAEITKDAKELRIKVLNPSRFSRVHVVATRYMPEFNLFTNLDTGNDNSLHMLRCLTPGCYYKSGRDIGDEYRYILERKHTQKFPGNMLDRPGLLIAPWSKRDTDAEKESLEQGGVFGSASDRLRASQSKRQRVRGMHGGRGAADVIGSCNFLKNSAVALYNIKPDKEGFVTVPMAVLRGKPYLRIAAVDPENLIVKEFTLPQTPVLTRELRLVETLKTDDGFAEKQRTTVLNAGETFEIKGAASARFEIYDSVEKLYTLFTALNKDETLKKFAFVAEWNKLEKERKQELYSEFACHELNLFLYFKDSEFFNKVVKAFVANKRDKRFIDYWLLGSDLSRYCTGLPYSHLNAAERALLAQRVAQRKNLTARDLREQVELLPIDQERINRLFDTALQGRALDAAEKGTFSRSELKREGAKGQGEDAFMQTSDMGNMKADKAPMLLAARSLKAKKAMPKPAAAPVEKQMAELEESVDLEVVTDEPFAAGVAVRKAQRRLFQKLESTKEWAENNYYKLPIEQQNEDLIKPNIFWQEYAEHKGERGFVSGKVAEAANSFSEMMLALAVMDLPFEAKEHNEMREAGGYQLTAASPVLVYHRQVQSCERAQQGQALVAQRFFRLDDRYRHEGNERFDKMVTEEFLKRVVYGAQVVLTNPTGGRLKLRVLLQIPQGALPVMGGFYTKGFYVTLAPYATHKQEYFFYFPESGRYPHYPVTVSRDEKVTGQAAAFVFIVVDKYSSEDKASWAWVSQKGSSDDVIAYLQENNLQRVELNEIAWRMKDKSVFTKVVDLLNDRCVYNDTLWSYSIFHNQPERISEYLQRSRLATQSGLWIDAPILKLDPVARNFYEHLEYAPLVNSRAHKIGKEHKIMNTRFRANYDKFMKVLSYKPKLDDEDVLAAAWAMSLQDRVSEAISWFAKVDRRKIVEQVQYDYLDAYLAFYQSDVKRAERIASGYAKYHVDRWRNKFELILAQVNEIQGEANLTITDRRNRDQAQAALASTEPALEMKVESGVIKLKGANIKGCMLNFYPMDIELLFSRSPFVEAGGANFSSVRPALSQQVEIKDANAWFDVKLPVQFASKNVMVEATAAGVRRTQVYYANTLDVQMVERYGQLTVRHAETGAALPAVYVKVYALINGRVKFFKDGYTDLRGRFDYVSLNSNEIQQAVKLSVLIMSDTLGAVVREVLPPAKVR
jgi:hypothetical protein